MQCLTPCLHVVSRFNRTHVQVLLTNRYFAYQLISYYTPTMYVRVQHVQFQRINLIQNQAYVCFVTIMKIES